MRQLFDPTAIPTQELIRPLAVSATILVLLALVAVPWSPTWAVSQSRPPAYTCGDTGDIESLCNDPEAVIITVSDAEVTEGPGATLDFVVTLSHSHSYELVEMDYETRASPRSYAAVAGEDYTHTSGTITFLPGGTTSQTIRIPVVDDALSEGVETLELRLTNASKATFVRYGAARERWRARGTILPDEDTTAPTVTVRVANDVTVPVSGHFGVFVEFSEPVEGFHPSELQVTNGTVTKFMPMTCPR